MDAQCINARGRRAEGERARKLQGNDFPLVPATGGNSTPSFLWIRPKQTASEEAGKTDADQRARWGGREPRCLPQNASRLRDHKCPPENTAKGGFRCAMVRRQPAYREFRPAKSRARDLHGAGGMTITGLLVGLFLSVGAVFFVCLLFALRLNAEKPTPRPGFFQVPAKPPGTATGIQRGNIAGEHPEVFSVSRAGSKHETPQTVASADAK